MPLSSQFELQAEPVAGTARVAINGERIDTGWLIEGRFVVFGVPPDYGAAVTVRYEVSR